MPLIHPAFLASYIPTCDYYATFISGPVKDETKVVQQKLNRQWKLDSKDEDKRGGVAGNGEEEEEHSFSIKLNELGTRPLRPNCHQLSQWTTTSSWRG